jgi:hypothetical protein
MADWLSKDGDFQLEQERQRALIRIKEKRAKAIDFLALNLRYANPGEDNEDEIDLDAAGVEIDLDEPYTIFDVRLFNPFYASSTHFVQRTYPLNKWRNCMMISNVT